MGNDDPGLPRAWFPGLSPEEQLSPLCLNLNSYSLGLADSPVRFQGWPLPRLARSQKDSPMANSESLNVAFLSQLT
jgi:hypothetical protein